MKSLVFLCAVVALSACASPKPAQPILARKLDIRFELRQQAIEVYGGVFLAKAETLVATGLCMAAEEA